MEIVRPSVKSLMRLSAVKRTETAIRTAYRSFDKMSDTSYKGVFRFCFNNMHWSVFEHQYLCVKIPTELVNLSQIDEKVDRLNHDFIRMTRQDKYLVLEGNLRSFMDLWKSLITEFSYFFMQDVNGDTNYSDYQVYLKCREAVREGKGDIDWKDKRQVNTYYQWIYSIRITDCIINRTFKDMIFIDLEKEVELDANEHFLPEYLDKIQIHYNPEYFTFNVVADIGVGREWLRHAPLRGVTQESTRYCSYRTKGFRVAEPLPCSYAGDLVHLVNNRGIPSWETKGKTLSKDQQIALELFQAYDYAHCRYNSLIAMGVPAQQARAVLPLGLIAEFVISGHWLNWAHFCKMRCAKDALPQIKYLADQVDTYFQKHLSEGRRVIFNRIKEGKDLVSAGEFCRSHTFFKTTID